MSRALPLSQAAEAGLENYAGAMKGLKEMGFSAENALSVIEAATSELAVP